MPSIVRPLAFFAALVFAIIAGVALAHAGTGEGSASWYALDGNRTANGEIMDSTRMTAAHRTLPMGTRLKVVNPRNGRAVVVRINDRGPFIKGRVLDLSKGAAKILGFVGRGHAKVRFARVARSTPLGTAPRFARLDILRRIARPAFRPQPQFADLAR